MLGCVLVGVLTALATMVWAPVLIHLPSALPVAQETAPLDALKSSELTLLSAINKDSERELADLTLQVRMIEWRLAKLEQATPTENQVAPVNESAEKLETQDRPIPLGQPTEDESLDWFVHITMLPIATEALRLSERLAEVMDHRIVVFEVADQGSNVRVCGLETQVQAQDVVRQLRRQGVGEGAWIGRGCQPG
ncbi:MAG: hypothetical protein CML33_02595 [Rhodobacteraceae bacterium]|nr:hypothetical protein [Paracoccaceae bacterium]